MDADRSRSLLDPGNADQYDQMYLDKAQSILYLPATNLAGYEAALDARLHRYANEADTAGLEAGFGADFGGFYGTEAKTVTTHANGAMAERAQLATMLARYGRYQHVDRQVRAQAAAGHRTEAAKAHMDPDPDTPTLPRPEQRAYADGLAALIAHHQFLTDRTVQDGERAMTAWTWLLPVSCLAIVALIVAGVRPRLTEYR